MSLDEGRERRPASSSSRRRHPREEDVEFDAKLGAKRHHIHESRYETVRERLIGSTHFARPRRDVKGSECTRFNSNQLINLIELQPKSAYT